jgi:hypothetical protein
MRHGMRRSNSFRFGVIGFQGLKVLGLYGFGV